MKIILLSMLGLVLLVSLFLLYKEYLKRQVLKLVMRKYAVIRPLIQRLNENEKISSDEILAMCADPSLRLAVFHLLQDHNQSHLFPSAYLTCQKGAESYFANWLEFPTELGATPKEIEFLIKVILDEKETLDYYVFKFMSNSTTWLTKRWMIGACGPYHVDSLPYDIPSRIYSRFKTLGSVTPESEVQWIHANIKGKW